MKIALYIENDVQQIVLTPEMDFEKEILKKFKIQPIKAVYSGGFYACQGGWVRESASNDSTIIVFEKDTSKNG